LSEQRSIALVDLVNYQTGPRCLREGVDVTDDLIARAKRNVEVFEAALLPTRPAMPGSISEALQLFGQPQWLRFFRIAFDVNERERKCGRSF
jgi:hypothetical protein